MRIDLCAFKDTLFRVARVLDDEGYSNYLMALSNIFYDAELNQNTLRFLAQVPFE